VGLLARHILSQDKATVISFVNFHALNLSLYNKNLFDALTSSNFVFRDGIAIECLLRCLGVAPGHNLNGSDFIPLLLQEAINCNRPIVLWGTNEKSLQLAKLKIEANGGNVEDVCNGFEPNSHYIKRLDLISNNALIILGMGMPKQEMLSTLIRKENTQHIIVNSGFFIDFTSGLVNRARPVLIKFRLEWLYRLWKEPRRLFARTVLGGIWFIFYATIYLIKQRISRPCKNQHNCTCNQPTKEQAKW
jgi:N-acetylglucosaminyldiphosphoundecaprenol N-acetyl-beta-D-mannosaminyltransferase